MKTLSVFMAISILSFTTHATAQDCSPLPGWEAVAAAAEGKYLIFGEGHGTEQSPQAFGDYACAVSAAGRVLVAVEMSSNQNDGMQQAWTASPDAFREQLMKGVPELETREDGVGSDAMVTMLARLHALKSAGRQIDIVAFNGVKDEAQREKFVHLPGQEPHESAQAENIRTAAEAGDYDHVVILVGSLHAAKAEFEFGSEPWKAMALKLAPEDEVISLVQQDAGGEAWYCTLRPDATREPGQPFTDDDIVCGTYPSSPDTGWSGEPRMSLWQEGDPADERYDGYFYLGPITASPPAFKTQSAD